LDGVADVARTVGELGADIMNALPLYPVDGTPFGELGAPTQAEITTARRHAGTFVAQMTHCTRCRADAVGLLGDVHGDEAINRLTASRSPARHRPYVAVCTQEGYLVNQHLGAADYVLVYENADIDGRVTPRLVEKRTTPDAGGGAGRWAHLAGVLHDCRALICHQLGGSPRTVLQSAGISVHESDGLISEALTDVFAGRVPRRALPARDCATSCAGPGDGCG
jgi:nitrogen fixation protein NifB